MRSMILARVLHPGWLVVYFPNKRAGCPRRESRMDSALALGRDLDQAIEPAAHWAARLPRALPGATTSRAPYPVEELPTTGQHRCVTAPPPRPTQPWRAGSHGNR